MKRLFAIFLILVLSGCGATPPTPADAYSVGYAEQSLTYGDLDQYYIAGYRNGVHPQGVLDPKKVKAAWIDNGAVSTVLIAVDCIALDRGTVQQIRSRLKNLPCDSINVAATHTHAGVDTLGLWGPVGISGKNESFQEQLVAAAVDTAWAAYENRNTGDLYYSRTETEGLQEDSREPIAYDSGLYQLRFDPQDPEKNGLRIVTFAAHAESLRGENTQISADFPGRVAKLVKEESGDDFLFLSGAAGGLIMTPVLTQGNDVANMFDTASKLAAYVLNPETEEKLTTDLAVSRVEWETALENTLFLYYKFLGILGSDIRQTATGQYMVQTELTLLRMGDVTLALLPGEPFPELLADSPEKMMIVGLANDEIGYIVPESDFLLHPQAPYILEAEGHYEETNSVGPNCGSDLLTAWKSCT